MCGFVVIGDPRRVSTQDALRAVRRLAHRGPDDEGVWSDSTVAMAHRRLAILDPSPAGRQPMVSRDGGGILVFNGEIYNYLELAALLPDPPRTRTDTEVLLEWLRRSDLAVLERLNGMFAFAYYDVARRTILLARDRMGEKPLYVRIAGGRLFGASELKAFDVRGPLDPDGANEYFAYGYIPAPRTIHRDIRKLRAGEWLRWHVATGHVQCGRYWRLPEPRFVPGGFARERLRDLLADAVRIRFRSDAPVGVFLSGGADSSAVAAAAVRSQMRVVTFTAGFPGEGDERPFARRVAAHLGTEHIEEEVPLHERGLFEELARHCDEPFADTSILPTYLICRSARAHVRVVLSGDGGDELFGGYARYRLVLSRLRRLRYLPAVLRQAAGAIASRRNWERSLTLEPPDHFVNLVTLLPAHVRSALLRRDLMDALSEPLDAPERRLRELLRGPGSFAERMMRADAQTYLAEGVLTKVDRASMKVALEIRCPLLDPRLVEAAFARIPERDRRRAFERRSLLFDAVRPWLPADFPIGRKQGFGIPPAARGALRDELVRWASMPSPYLERTAQLRMAHDPRTPFDWLFAIAAFVVATCD
jgi:asparagine synthase (glutamine-hydrolysing)